MLTVDLHGLPPALCARILWHESEQVPHKREQANENMNNALYPSAFAPCCGPPEGPVAWVSSQVISGAVPCFKILVITSLLQLTVCMQGAMGAFLHPVISMTFLLLVSTTDLSL
jgi:hypothetical protein